VSARPSVLWVTEEVPDRSGGGGNQRQSHLLRALAEHADIDLLVAGRVDDAEVRAATRACVEVPIRRRDLHANPVLRRAHAVGIAGLRATSLDVWAAAPVRAAFEPEVRARAGAVSAVIVHHQGLGPLLTIPRHGGARWAFHVFHASGDRAEQLASVAPKRARAALLRREAHLARAAEREAITHADVLLVATDADARRLAVPGVPACVVAQGVDVERFPDMPLPDEPAVLFAGSLDYEPNVDGLLWLTRSIWPAIRAQVPAARLVVVGRDPVPSVLALDGGDGIEVHPNVPDMRDWLAMARAVVIPLRAGTGVRVKALEAFAARRPVVATHVAIEGIPVGDGDADIRDDPAGFADAVVRLLVDRELAEERARAGRRLVEAHASWRAAGDQLAHALFR